MNPRHKRGRVKEEGKQGEERSSRGRGRPRERMASGEEGNRTEAHLSLFLTGSMKCFQRSQDQGSMRCPSKHAFDARKTWALSPGSAILVV